MELVESKALPWIALTQVGEALAHGQWVFTNGASSDRLAGLAAVAVPEAKDEEVAQLVFLMMDSAEVRADPELLAELGPFAKDLVLGLEVLGSGAFGADSQSSAEVSPEAVCSFKWSSCQGVSCG